MTTFQDSLDIHAAGDNRWVGPADPNYAHMGGQGRFGGWTAAMLLRAAMLEPGTSGQPLSLTVLFTEAINSGEVEVSTRLLRSGARLQFWRSEISQGGKLCAHAQVTLGVRRAADSFSDIAMPKVVPPEDETLFETVPPFPFGQQFRARWATRGPLDPLHDASGPTGSLVWVCDVSHRKLDHCLLAALADFAPPRPMWKRKAPLQSSTVSMTVHFHATPDELAHIGGDFILSQVDCLRAEGGYFEHHLKLWSREGQLLASSIQVAAYRG